MSEFVRLFETIAHGASALACNLSEQQEKALGRYVEQLHRWNRVCGLTGIKTPSQMVTHHLLDSLAVHPYLKGKNVLDVGSGAGLPGIPLAIACPHRTFTLLDINQKKVIFLTQCVHALALKNVVVVRSRVQDYQPALVFDTIVSRAFAHCSDFVAQSKHLIGSDGRWVAMKGTRQVLEKEIVGLQATIYPLQVPGLKAKRHVVVVTH